MTYGTGAGIVKRFVIEGREGTLFIDMAVGACLQWPDNGPGLMKPNWMDFVMGAAGEECREKYNLALPPDERLVEHELLGPTLR